MLKEVPNVIDNQRYDAPMDVMTAPRHRGCGRAGPQPEPQRRLQGEAGPPGRFPHLDAVRAQDDDIAVGVVRAIQQAHRTDFTVVLGGVGMKESVKMVMDGDPLVPADVLDPPDRVDTAIKVAATHDLCGSAVLGTCIVTAPGGPSGRPPLSGRRNGQGGPNA